MKYMVKTKNTIAKTIPSPPPAFWAAGFMAASPPGTARARSLAASLSQQGALVRRRVTEPVSASLLRERLKGGKRVKKIQ